MGFTLWALGHTVYDGTHVMSTGDITARELTEPLPSSAHERKTVFIPLCFPSSSRTTAQDELLENGRTQEPSVRTAVFHAEDQTSDLLSKKQRKYLTLSCCHILKTALFGVQQVGSFFTWRWQWKSLLKPWNFNIKKVTSILDKVLNAAACQGQGTHSTVCSR